MPGTDPKRVGAGYITGFDPVRCVVARCIPRAYASGMRVIGFTVLCLAAGLAAAAPTYRWVDAQGQVHYSDRPVEGAQEVELKDIQSYTPPAIDTASVNANSTPAQTPAAADDGAVPKTVSIVAPRPIIIVSLSPVSNGLEFTT